MPLFLNDSEKIILILDWSGSLFMMGSLWGWIYSKISKSIMNNLHKANRHNLALKRYLMIKYGKNFSKIPEYERFIKHRKKIGVFQATSLIDALLLLREEKKIHKRLKKYGLSTKDDEAEWERQSKDTLIVAKVSLSYFFLSAKYKIFLLLIKIIDKITYSIFSGKLGFSLFVLGFIMWNLAKLLSFEIL